jgi:LmbE family N-acetylglucosaminyl deacetylase
LAGWLFVAAVSVAMCGSARCEEAKKDAGPRKLRVAVVGAHPDDPESCAGGLITMLTRAGHEVFVGYMVCYREGRQYFGKPEVEVRHREADAACKIMNATPKFFPYSAGNLVADRATVAALAGWLKEVKPDIVLTHWPFDTHPDHHATCSLVWQCYNNQGRQGGWNLYLFEAATGVQTLAYNPQWYLDIGAVREVKRQACFCHKSQEPDTPGGFWRLHHERMHRERGAECGVQSAEAYALIEARTGCALLPVPFVAAKNKP